MSQPVSDPILGKFQLSGEGAYWVGRIKIGDRTISFQIAGESKPDVHLIAHAHDIVRSFSEFEDAVSKFLLDEARSRKHFATFANEIRRLSIEDICLWWPDRPDDGMIYFRGPDEFRIWRCDYVGRKPQRLGFDS